MSSPPLDPAPHAREIVTFYSYKGGTGRTMALANAACLFARQGSGRRVLAIDWDLEAPGLHYYLRPAAGAPAELPGPGLVEYFARVQAALDAAGDGDVPQDAAAVLAGVPLSAHCHETTVPNVHLMPAGTLDDTYQARLGDLDWQAIYRRAPTLFLAFAGLLTRDYDVVLVDSRTGLTDISGICTSLLPDKVVVVFTANQQSLTGVEQLVRSSVEYRRGSPDVRPLLVYPLPSRIDGEREQLRRQWRHGDTSLGIEGFQPQFERILRTAYALETCALGEYFNEVQVQHSPDYSYGERVAALAARDHDRFSIIRSYEALLEWLGSSAAPWETPAQARERVRLEGLIEREQALLRGDTIDNAALIEVQGEIVRLSRRHRGTMHLDTITAMDRLVRTTLSGGGDPSASLALLDEIATTLPSLRVPVRVHAIGTMLTAAPGLRAQGRGEAAERFREAALAAGASLSESDGTGADVLGTLEALGAQLQDAAAFREARAIRELVFERRRRLAGDDDEATLAAHRRLAETLEAVGDFAAARAALEDATTTAARVLGEGHPETVSMRQQLAEVLAAQGHTDEALTLAEQVLEARIRRVGPRDAATLATQALRSDILRDTGRLDEARAVCEAVLEGRREVLGNEHPRTLDTEGRLAEILLAQGQLAEARSRQEDLVAVCRRVRGHQHPDTLRAEASLARTLWAMGALADARALEARVLEVSRDVLGPAHPSTLTAMNDLASTLWSQGDLAGARALEEQALETRRRVLGEDHPATLVSLGNLAETLRQQGELSEAREVGMAVVEARQRVLGPEHPETLAAMNNLALTLGAMGEAGEARRLLDQALDTRRRVQGDDHPDTLKAAHNLAELLRVDGDLEAARRLHEQALSARRRVLGDDHPDTLTSMTNLALAASAQDDYATARPLLERVLERYLRVAGESDPRTLAARTHLARILIGLGDLGAAQAHQEHVASAQARLLEKARPESPLGTAREASGPRSRMS